MARKLSNYHRQKNLEHAEIISENDTDSDSSQTTVVPELDGDYFFQDTPILPLLDSPASADQESWGGLLEAGTRSPSGDFWVLDDGELYLDAVGPHMLGGLLQLELGLNMELSATTP
jgi:hypothetical protein